MGFVTVPSPRMVGRDQELRVLTTVVEKGGTAFLLGEPGIGKSRLATAAADHALSLGMRVLRGRARTADATASLRPLSEALLSLARDGGLPTDSELVPYRPALARFVPEWRDSTAFDGDETLLVVAEALLRLLNVLGRDTGCVLVLEDLHDADAETVAVLDHIAGNLAKQRVAVVATARYEQGPMLELVRGYGRRGDVVLVEPTRLDRSQVGELIASCLGVAQAAVSCATVDQLFQDSEGVPFVVEELLDDMVTGGRLVAEPDGWSARSPRDATDVAVPRTVVYSVASQVRRLGPELAELLIVAAVFGRRFPLPVLRSLSGISGHDLLLRLRPAVANQLVGPDRVEAGWYSFRHPLTAPALLEQVGAGERAELSQRAAEAVETGRPGLPGEWRTVAAGLWLMAGEVSAARRLFTDAGRRALTDGAAAAAVRLLRRAHELAADCRERIAVLEPLLTALADAGQVEPALALASNADDDLCLDDSGRVTLHMTLALVALRAGLWLRGNEEVVTTRGLLGPGAPPGLATRIDLIAANLTLLTPGADRDDNAEELALRALAEAARSRLPVIACEALELLGTLARHRDLAESDARFRRMAELAHRHRLPSMRLRSLARSGFNDTLRSGDDSRLRQACARAFEIGAITEGHVLEAELVLTAVLRGEFVRATELADHCLPVVTRLGLRHVVRAVLIAKASMFAHLGQRSAMVRAVRSLVAWDGQLPLVQGVCEAFCALAEEDRQGASDALDLAIAADAGNSANHVTAGPHGLRVLLGALDGEMDWSHHREAAVSTGGDWAWNRQFLLLAHAVLAGRDGRQAEAAAAMAEHSRIAEPFAMARQLGLRLAAEAALADGWGEPASWLREAEEYFHIGRMTAVANACRTLMRRTGWTATQRRCGIDGVPARLRARGITVREHEVLRLLAERLGNSEIATRLYISPRTVEKHVASLLAKTGEHDRTSLHRFAIDHVSDLAS